MCEISREVKMSELSCDTLFIGRNETHDLSRYQISDFSVKSARAVAAVGSAAASSADGYNLTHTTAARLCSGSS